MSAKYDEYIITHKSNVVKAFDWISKKIPGLFPNEEEKSLIEWQCANNHDQSKYDAEEYEAYDNYFYGNRSYENVEKFKYAWLHHIHNNPHHWQYWILMNDEPEEGIVCLEIPFNYVIEMICDWWSFSWKTGNLYEIFDWYLKHKDNIKLNSATRTLVEDILNQIHTLLDEEHE